MNTTLGFFSLFIFCFLLFFFFFFFKLFNFISFHNKKLKKQNKEIAIPGFLLLDFGTQIRKEEKLGSGGAGSVFSGALLDHELISQHETDKIALKLVPKSPILSDDESKEVFLQEVSLMWYAFLLSFSFFFIFFFLFTFFLINSKSQSQK